MLMITALLAVCERAKLATAQPTCHSPHPPLLLPCVAVSLIMQQFAVNNNGEETMAKLSKND